MISSKVLKLISVSCFILMLSISTAFAQEKTTVEDDIVVPSAPVEIVAPALDPQMSIWHLVSGAGPVVQFVLWLLVVMSIVTWGIVVTKFLSIRKAKKQTASFDSAFWESKNLAKINEIANKLTASPVARVYTSGHKELTAILSAKERGDDNTTGSEGVDTISRALVKAKAEQINRLEVGTTFLATTASAAPFIGLFGTVWGIMHAFMGLSHTKSSSIQAVAPGISEALIATAIGLAAAIPAAIFYNVFMQHLRVLSRNMDMFSAEFLNIARRHFLK